MQDQATEKSHRLRIITLSILAGIIVVLIGVWLITAAMRSVNRGQTASDQPAPAPTVSSTEEKPATAAPSSTSVSSPADQYQNTPAPSAPAETTPTSTSSDIPSTGPEGVLFSAVLIGVAIFLLGHNLQLAKTKLAD